MFLLKGGLRKRRHFKEKEERNGKQLLSSDWS